MVTLLEIKNFSQSEFYQNLVFSLKSQLPMINFSDDNMQMYNIFAKMVNNSALSITELTHIEDKEELLRYGKARLLNEISTDEDFLEGYKSDPEDLPELISYSYSKLLLIQVMIEYFFLANNKKEEFMAFLKKQRIPSAKKFLNELVSIYSSLQ